MHRQFLPLPLHGDQSAKYLRQYDCDHVLTDNEIKPWKQKKKLIQINNQLAILFTKNQRLATKW